METRIIKAVFGASKSIVAPKRFKNDWGQVLEFVGIDIVIKKQRLVIIDVDEQSCYRDI